MVLLSFIFFGNLNKNKATYYSTDQWTISYFGLVSSFPKKLDNITSVKPYVMAHMSILNK